MRVLSLLCAISIGLLGSGCGLSFPMGPMSVADDMPTGSIARQVSPLSPELDEEDWRRAQGALAIALDPVGNGAPASWDNPESGLKGSFTPVGQAFVKAEDICRTFIAQIAGGEDDKTLRGTACKTSGRDWAIQEIKPWKA